jgi:hypothetical protein
MSSYALSGVADARPATFALVRAAAADRAAANAAVRQGKINADDRVAAAAEQARAMATEDRQAEAARQQTSLVQAVTGAVLNVYA